MKYLKYLKYVLIHKWFVFIECCKLGVPIRGLLHDLSKFRPSELFAYTNYFYGKKGKTLELEIKREYEFNIAWLKHIHRNKHHWQYWILYCDNGKEIFIDIPLKYKKEMISDWKGAGKAQGYTEKDECKNWYLKNRSKMSLNRLTRQWIEEQLGIDRGQT